MTATPLCTVRFGPNAEPIVATLGDPLASTCSIEFAKTWLAPEGGTIKGYASFEEAADAVVAGDADYLLVPGAYRQVSGLIFDPRLEPEDTFQDRLPTIVLISADPDADPSVAPPVLYFQPALEREVRELEAMWAFSPQRREVSSNPVACDEVLANVEAYGLTNLIAAQAYKAPVIMTVCEGRKMPCIVFRVPSDAPVDLRPALGIRSPSRTVRKR